MAISHLPSRWASSPSTARILAFITLLLPLPSVARAQAAAAVPIADSAHAVAIACAVVLALRPPAKRYRCQVERYQETPTGYVIRVHEQVPRGAAPLVFERSEVLLSKTEPSVVVTRAPELQPVAAGLGLRKVAADLLTTLGWVGGTLHLPSYLPLEEHIALGRHEFKLTGVAVPGEPERLRFLALRRDAVLIVAPAMPEEEDPGSAFSVPREVACLLPGGILRGTLQVFTNLRLSDHLQQQGPVVTMRRCLLTPYGATANSPGARTMHTAIVNLRHAIGIAEGT